MRKYLLLAAFFCFISTSLFAQTVNQNSGWLFFLKSTKLSEKWGLHLDVQVRSADEWGYVRNVLVRPGLTYFINKNSNVTAGYLLATTKTQLSNLPDVNTNEHRIWEQYIYSHKLGSGALSHRFRLEQRFIGQPTGDDIFSQRIRYFFRFVQPLKKQEEAFTKGAFAALQNETFFNLQNKDQLNGSLFDQNRVYLAAGYRFSKKFDVEAGYLNQAINGRANNTVNHVAQLAFYTRF